MPRHKHKDYELRPCESCSKNYKPRAHNQRVCSAKCRDEFKYATYQKPHYLKNRQSDKPLRHWYKTEWEKLNPTQKYTGKEVKLWHGAKARAEQNNLDFDIEVFDIVIPTYCPILNIKLEYKTRYAPSLDRKDSSKGYIKGNIWVISKIANRIKTDASKEELKRFAEWALRL